VAVVRTDVSEEHSATILFLRIVLQLLVTANVVPSSLILSILMMEEMRFSETSVFTRATRLHIPEDGIVHSHRRENPKSYVVLRLFKDVVLCTCGFVLA
jgi:hypothetical protein